jgi:glycerol dehydrogenase
MGITTLTSPSKFILGKGAIELLGNYVQNFGKTALLISHSDDSARVKKELDIALKDTNCIYAGFNGESSKKEIARIEEILKKESIDVIIGLGGGKSLDTAKAVADNTNKPVIIVPTIASTDAPTSALAIIYSEDGVFEEYMFLKKNPDIVLVDSGVIAKAPVRFLISGMGDALATYFEARACQQSCALNMSGGQSTKAAFAIAKTCYETLMEDSFKAKASCEAGVVTKSLENIIEANILLSGLGFESSGLAAAHAIHDGLTMLDETHSYYHGEKVSFGVIVQLVLENAPHEELLSVIEYCKKLGLPKSLKDFGITNLDDERLMKVAIEACSEKDTMSNMPFIVTTEDVCAAIRTADLIGSAI